MNYTSPIEATPRTIGISAAVFSAVCAALYVAEVEGYIDFVAESVDYDVSGTATVEDEGYSYGRRLRPGYYWFTATVEGEHERFSVPKDIADTHKPGDTIEITYDRSHWRDGSTSVSGVRAK